SAYVTGYISLNAFSPTFPTTPGAFQTTPGGGSQDAIAAKINPSGTALIYSTYLGGSNDEIGKSIAVDSAGNAYVTGDTSSANFPTQNAWQPTYSGAGGAYPHEAFVTKLSANGSSLVYSTYLGGSNGEQGNGIAVDGAGHAYVTGFTNSANFPTVNPIQL